MMVTLAGGIATAITDPILIFWLDFGVDGAAMATVLSRIMFVVVGSHGAIVVHRLMARPSLAQAAADFRPMFAVAGPAILTNLASPLALAFIMRVLAPFGEAIIAANAVVDRLVPIAFGVLFALTGAVGPIFGQNLGAGEFGRLKMALRDALVFVLIYSAFAWIILAAAYPLINRLFNASGPTADYIAFFCVTSGLVWGPLGLLFVANAAFNNLGFPLYSTAFNWGRATIGTAPLAAAGASMFGPNGVILGIAGGALVFGLASVAVAFRQVNIIAIRGNQRIAKPDGTA